MEHRDRNIRISVDLSRFFSDHRKKSLVLVKSNIKTISELKNHISKIFNITNFFLIATHHFLPDKEDAGILNNNELICVMPINKDQLDEKEDYQPLSNDFDPIEENPVKTKRKKRPPEVVKEKSPESLGKDKHGKKRRKNDSEYNGLCEEKSQKIKKVKENCSKWCTSSDPDVAESTQLSEQTAKLPLLQSHSFENTESSSNFVEGRNNEPTVRLSRHVDSPFETFKQYMPPKLITDQYLKENKVNIVKIDIVQGMSNTDAIPEHLVGCNSIINDENMKQEVTTSEKYVKKIVDHFENMETLDKMSAKTAVVSKNSDCNQTEASNYTKIYLSQKDANLSFAAHSQPDAQSTMILLSPVSSCVEIPITKKEVSATDLSSTISLHKNDLADQLDGQAPSISTFQYKAAVDSISNECLSNSSHDVYNDGPSLNNGLYKNNFRKIGGVGQLVEQLRDFPVAAKSNVSDSSTSKRKRVRKRKRISKIINDNNPVGDLEVLHNSPTQPNQILFSKQVDKSNIHVRFTNEETEEQIVQTGFGNEEVITRSSSKDSQQKKSEDSLSSFSDRNSFGSSVMKAAVITDECEKFVLENKPIFSLEYVEGSPLMSGKLEPKLGDFIAFKILKMSADCTPQLSDYVIGEVVKYQPESKLTHFRITRGIEEFSSPSGKLFLEETKINEAEETNLKELPWKNVLEPRLLFP